MGLDLLDIAYRIEKSFGVRFDVGDFAEMPTKERPEPVYHTKVGDVYELILEKRKKLDLPKGPVRPETLAIRDVRLALSRVLHLLPEEFRPGDRLARLLPLEDRRKQWRRLRRQLPGLGPLRARTTRFRAVRWTACFLLAAALVWGLYHFDVFHPDLPMAIVGWPLLCMGSLALAAFAVTMLSDLWLANQIPKEAETVELLAKTHLARNRRHYIDECGGNDSDEDLWHTLRVIIADALGVDIDEVTKESDLVHDLGAD